jgi:hypothetical protein
MKKMISNILATTGIVLLVLSVVALCYGGTVIFINTVFQILTVNTVVYLGLYLLELLEFRYPILETGVKLLYILGIVLLTGWLLGWYEFVSVAVLGIMTVIVMIVCVCLDTLNLRTEVKEINELLEER